MQLQPHGFFLRPAHLAAPVRCADELPAKGGVAQHQQLQRLGRMVQQGQIQRLLGKQPVGKGHVLLHHFGNRCALAQPRPGLFQDLPGVFVLRENQNVELIRLRAQGAAIRLQGNGRVQIGHRVLVHQQVGHPPAAGQAQLLQVVLQANAPQLPGTCQQLGPLLVLLIHIGVGENHRHAALRRRFAHQAHALLRAGQIFRQQHRLLIQLRKDILAPAALQIVPNPWEQVAQQVQQNGAARNGGQQVLQRNVHAGQRHRHGRAAHPLPQVPPGKQIVGVALVHAEGLQAVHGAVQRRFKQVQPVRLLHKRAVGQIQPHRQPHAEDADKQQAQAFRQGPGDLLFFSDECAPKLCRSGQHQQQRQTPKRKKNHSHGHLPSRLAFFPVLVSVYGLSHCASNGNTTFIVLPCGRHFLSI